MPDGRHIPLSLVNNTAPFFELCRQYRLADLFPHDSADSGYDDRVAHFMALCMKIVYEEPEVIQVPRGTADTDMQIWLFNHGQGS